MKLARPNVSAFLREYTCPCADKHDAQGLPGTNCVDTLRNSLEDKIAHKTVLELRRQRFETSAHEDAPWYIRIILGCRVVDAATKKIKVAFNLAGVSVCKATHFVALGYAELNRKRQELVARVQRGETSYTHQKAGGRRGAVVGKGDLCRAWIRKEIGLHGKFIPAPRSTSGQCHVAIKARSIKGWHWDYTDAVSANDEDPYYRCVKISRFREIWHTETKIWIAPDEQVDRLGGMTWEVRIRSDRTRGIRICDTCAKWNRLRKNAKTWEEKEDAIKGKAAHLDDVKCTRRTYGEHQLEARTSTRVGSALVDATDMVKTRWPLVQDAAKAFERLKQVKFKVTGFVDHILGYFMLVTMPWIVTGGNLSCTIIMLTFSYGNWETKEKVYFQWDGASDNVNTTCI